MSRPERYLSKWSISIMDLSYTLAILFLVECACSILVVYSAQTGLWMSWRRYWKPMSSKKLVSVVAWRPVGMCVRSCRMIRRFRTRCRNFLIQARQMGTMMHYWDIKWLCMNRKRTEAAWSWWCNKVSKASGMWSICTFWVKGGGDATRRDVDVCEC